MKYGIKDELFDLVSMRGIGRVRARKLFNNGIKNASDILSADLKILSELIGPSLAKKIKNQ